MTRRSLSTRERVRLFELHGGRCYLCGGKIDGTREAWEVEHELPVALGGDESDENRKLAHVKCHKPKTAEDVGRIRKADRERARHIGAKARPRNTIPGSRGTKWKKRLDGTTVLR